MILFIHLPTGKLRAAYSKRVQAKLYKSTVYEEVDLVESDNNSKYRRMVVKLHEKASGNIYWDITLDEEDCYEFDYVYVPAHILKCKAFIVTRTLSKLQNV